MNVLPHIKFITFQNLPLFSENIGLNLRKSFFYSWLCLDELHALGKYLNPSKDSLFSYES